MKRLLYFMMFLTACQPISIAVQTPKPNPSPEISNAVLATPITTSTPSSMAQPFSMTDRLRLIATLPAVPFDERQGYFKYPIRYGDAGLVSLYPGRSLTISWEEAPQGANSYDIFFVPFDEEAILLGSDHNFEDGIQVEWIVPELIGGTLVGMAYYNSNNVIYSGGAHEIYSGKLPPQGVCSLSSSNLAVLDVYLAADLAAERIAFITPGAYAIVEAKTKNGWYRLDASQAIAPQTGAPSAEIGWVSTAQNVDFFGPCEDLPLVEH